MDGALWPSVVPEMFQHAAGRLTAGGGPDVVGEQLREALGLDQPLDLGGEDVFASLDPVAARSEVGQQDQIALALVTTVGRQLHHQYPSSSLLWDVVCDEMHEVLATFGFDQPVVGVWNREAEAGREVVVQLQGPVRRSLRGHAATGPDERRFTLCWGVVLPSVPFCRHDGPHLLSCCAVAGGMGSLREPHGEHRFVLSVGMVVEQVGGPPLRLIGREGFRSRMHRLAAYCDAMADEDRLVALIADRPWRAGIGIAEQLRNADPASLRRLLA